MIAGYWSRLIAQNPGRVLWSKLVCPVEGCSCKHVGGEAAEVEVRGGEAIGGKGKAGLKRGSYGRPLAAIVLVYVYMRRCVNARKVDGDKDDIIVQRRRKCKTSTNANSAGRKKFVHDPWLQIMGRPRPIQRCTKSESLHAHFATVAAARTLASKKLCRRRQARQVEQQSWELEILRLGVAPVILS